MHLYKSYDMHIVPYFNFVCSLLTTVFLLFSNLLVAVRLHDFFGLNWIKNYPLTKSPSEIRSKNREFVKCFFNARNGTQHFRLKHSDLAHL